MLDKHIGTGYTEVNVPYIVNSNALYGTGQLPKFGDDLFRLAEPDDYYLIPTAEVPVSNMVAGEIVEPDRLPLRFVRAHAVFPCRSGCGRTRCTRHDPPASVREGGADQHRPPGRFRCLPRSHAGQRRERASGSGAAYRVVDLCGGDIGFSAARTFDLEVWLPSQQTYREISSTATRGTSRPGAWARAIAIRKPASHACCIRSTARAGGRACAGRGIGKPPARGRQRGRSGGPAALHGRHRRHRTECRLSQALRYRKDRIGRSRRGCRFKTTCFRELSGPVHDRPFAFAVRRARPTL